MKKQILTILTFAVFTAAAATGAAQTTPAAATGPSDAEIAHIVVTANTIDIEAGKFLILIYARKDQEAAVRHMMKTRHPEAEFAGLDSHFVNPFSAV